MKILSRHPPLVYAPYAAVLIVLILHFAEAFENRFLTIHVPLAACMSVLALRLIHGYYTDRSPLHKKQIEWFTLGGGVQTSLWLGLTALPLIVTGRPFVREEISPALMIFYPLTLAAAMTRYRLMDIESIFDYTSSTVLTLLILEGAGDLFSGLWNGASNYGRRLRPGTHNSIQILRTVQESISNIIKHAGATKASIGFFSEESGLTVAVSDDGKGR